MKSTLVLVPLKCPHCKQTNAVPYEAAEITRALGSPKDFRLYTTCHDVSWKASEADRESLTKSLGKGRLGTITLREVEEVATDSTNFSCRSRDQRAGDEFGTLTAARMGRLR